MKDKVCIFWFRRDLRLDDNVGLYQALQSGFPVLPIFIFDTEILEKLPKDDARVSFIHGQLQKINSELKDRFNGSIASYKGNPISIFEKLVEEFSIHTVYTNQDYEPYAIQRDASVKSLLKEKGIGFKTFKDQVIFETDEVVKDDGQPYVVYTPYMKRWKEKFNASVHVLDYDTFSNFNNVFASRLYIRLSGQRLDSEY